MQKPNKQKKLKKNVLPISCDSNETPSPPKKIKLTNHEQTPPKDFGNDSAEDSSQDRLEDEYNKFLAQQSDSSYLNDSTDDSFGSDSDIDDAIHSLDNLTSENNQGDSNNYLTDNVTSAQNSQEDEKYLSLLSNILDENVVVRLPTTKWFIRINKKIETVFFCSENFVFNESEFPQGAWRLNLCKMVLNFDILNFHIFINWKFL